MCDLCAVDDVEEKVSEAMAAAGIEEFDIEDDEPGEGCTACGNPAYPRCKDSCPMYDN